MPTPDKQLSAEQSRQIADTIREEIARRRISRQSLAELAKLSLSTLEKVLGGRRPFTLATTVRLEQALGVSLRKTPEAPRRPRPPATATSRPMGSGPIRAARWRGSKGPMSRCVRRSATRTRSSPTAPRSVWDAAASSLVFHESERQDAAFTQFGEVAVPNQSGHIYLVTNRHGQHRLITVARLAISGEMYGIITTLLAGRGSLLTPIAAPIAYLPIKMVASPTFGRISSDDRQLRAVPRAFAADDRRAVCAVFAGIGRSLSAHFSVIVCLVRSCALGRTIQYSRGVCA